MKDKRITQMKFRAERDLKLSHAARCLVMRACSHVYVNPHRLPEDSFAMTWRTVQGWVGVGEKQAYRLITELQKADYIRFDELVGSPPQAHFFLTLNSVKNVRIEPDKNVRIDSVKKGGLHISNPYGKKMKKKRGVKTATSAQGGTTGGIKSSLRSEYGLGDDKAAPPRELNRAGRDALESEAARIGDAMRQAAGLG